MASRRGFSVFRSLLRQRSDVTKYTKYACTLQRRYFVSTATRNMPLCTLETNKMRSEIPENIHKDLSQLLARILNKPEKAVVVTLSTDVTMCRDGNEQPAVVVQIHSIAVFDAQRNPKYAKEITEFLVENLKIPAERIALFFHPLDKHQAGHVLYAEMTK